MCSHGVIIVLSGICQSSHVRSHGVVIVLSGICQSSPVRSHGVVIVLADVQLCVVALLHLLAQSFTPLSRWRCR